VIQGNDEESNQIHASIEEERKIIENLKLEINRLKERLAEKDNSHEFQLRKKDEEVAQKLKTLHGKLGYLQKEKKQLEKDKNNNQGDIEILERELEIANSFIKNLESKINQLEQDEEQEKRYEEKHPQNNYSPQYQNETLGNIFWR